MELYLYEGNWSVEKPSSFALIEYDASWTTQYLISAINIEIWMIWKGKEIESKNSTEVLHEEFMSGCMLATKVCDSNWPSTMPLVQLVTKKKNKRPVTICMSDNFQINGKMKEKEVWVYSSYNNNFQLPTIIIYEWYMPTSFHPHSIFTLSIWYERKSKYQSYYITSILIKQN